MTAAAEPVSVGGTVSRGARYRALGANRDFRLLWVGQVTSELGSSISFLALPLLVLSLTGSTALAGLVGTVVFLTMWLAQLPAGYVADMYDRRRVMLACDAGRVALFVVAALAVVTGVAPTAVLLVVVAASTALWAAFGAAQMQAVRLIVARDQIPEAVGVTQARGYAVDLIGPLLAGWLFAVGRAIPLVVDALTFVVSLLCVWRIRTAMAPQSRPVARRILPDVGSGWALMWRHPFLRAKTTYSVTTNVVVSALLYVLILGSGGNSLLVGTSISVAAGAGLLGAALGPVVARRAPIRTLLVTVALVRAGSLALAAALGGPVMFAVVLATVMLLGPMASAALSAAQVLLVPGELLGRASGASSFVASSLQPVAPLAAGLMLQTLPLPTVQLALAGAFVAVGVAAALLPGLSWRPPA